MAPLPRARVPPPRELNALHRARQPEGRRRQAPKGGRGRAERGVPRDGGALRLGRDARAHEDATRYARRRERGVAGGRRDRRGAARRRRETREAQPAALLKAQGHEEAGLRGAGALAAPTAAGGPLRGLRVDLPAQGTAQLPRGLQAQLLLGETPRRRKGRRPEGHGVHGRGAPWRGEARHAPAAPDARAQPLLDACRRSARGEAVPRVGRRPHPALGRPGRAVLRGGGRPHIPEGRIRGAGLQRGAGGARARAPLRQAQTRAGVRDGAGIRAPVAQVQELEADSRDQPGQDRRRAGGRQRRRRGRLRARRGPLRGGAGR